MKKDRCQISRRDFLDASTASQSAILSKVGPALAAFAKLQGDAVTPEEEQSWRRQYLAMPEGVSKAAAAKTLALDSPRSWETIRRHI